MASNRITRRAPEKDTLQKEFSNVSKSIALGTDLALFGGCLVSNEFLSADAVRSYLDVMGISKFEKASNLIGAINTNITSARSQEDITRRFNDYLKMLHEELDLKQLARQLADRNQKLSEERGLVYWSPLSSIEATGCSSSEVSSTDMAKSPPTSHAKGNHDDKVTLAELLEEVKLEESALEVKVTEAGLDHIATIINPKDWMTYARSLGISDTTLNDTKEDITWSREQRYQGLVKWKQKNAFRAKYKKLVELFLDKENAELAQEVCEFLK